MTILSKWLEAAASARGSQRALIYRDSYLSWRGLQHRVERRAQELRAMGITTGTMVGLMLGNVPDLVILILALDALGAVSVPIDPTTGSRDLDMILDAAPIRAVVTRPVTNSTSPAAPNKLQAGKRIAPRALRVTDASRSSSPKHTPESKRRLAGSLLTINFFKLPAFTLEHDAPSMVALTSDAGGDPKGVLRQDEHLESIALSVESALGAEPGQSIVLPTPFHYSSGFDIGFLPALRGQLTMILEDEFSANGLMRLLKENVGDFVLGTPAQYSTVCQSVSGPQSPPKARCLCVHSPGLKAAASAFGEKFQAVLIPVFHSAETGPIAINLNGIPSEETLVGAPLPGVAIRVSNADGNDLPTNVTGQIWVKTDGASESAVPKLATEIRSIGSQGVPIGRKNIEGWFRTGDVGFVDVLSGRLHIRSREDDLVWVEGRRLALGEVEGCIESFASVKHAEARVVYDEHKGAMIVVRVVPSRPCRAEDIIEHCARYLAPFKVPRQIELCGKL
jgi:acyl-CoA synthetase (AMP-forming)/AMP-acid ligase II